ncbi:MAG: winged helix-turn-helix domain-containing protein [Pseudoflavonifractor sp.]|nr:winged helix-turn-helix domain-containing protein [Pseudoflavonifractor sp.]
MNTETIGTWAGLLWNALNEADVLGTKQIKKITKLKDKELYAAIGWLAREDKIEIQESPEDPKEFLITLVQDK